MYYKFYNSDSLQSNLHMTGGYILKFDIRKFFDNINHEILKEKLEGIDDTDVKKLLFALWYLNGLDRMIKKQFGIK